MTDGPIHEVHPIGMAPPPLEVVDAREARADRMYAHRTRLRDRVDSDLTKAAAGLGLFSFLHFTTDLFKGPALTLLSGITVAIMGNLMWRAINGIFRSHARDKSVSEKDNRNLARGSR